MYTSRKLAGTFAAVVILSGCATPFAGRTTYDPAVRNAPGTITLSDPKLFTREALISERVRDIKWIDGLITASESKEKVSFKPELVREVEQITAMAAAIGLKFDPASALAYRRDKETGDIQHQIDELKLQLQLNQLQRSVELAEANPNSQAESGGENSNKSDSVTASDSTPVPASAADQLKSAIEKLNVILVSRLDSDGKPAAATTITSSPFDDFRDRSAYRDMLKAAYNAAELDQLHDYANARLIRLNFQASVIPDSDNSRSLGAIQIHVTPPSLESDATQQFLRHWLEYINTNKNYRSSSGSGSGKELNIRDPAIRELLLGGSFEKVKVQGIELLLPIVNDENGLPQSPSFIYRRSHWDEEKETEAENYNGKGKGFNAITSISRQGVSENLIGICADTFSGKASIAQLFQEAEDRGVSIEYIQLATRVAHSIGAAAILRDDIDKMSNNASGFRSAVLGLINKLPQCKAYLERRQAPTLWKALSKAAISGNNGIRVYEIGPREQVQQVSTVARSASSLALAASLAASNPGSGAGAEAAASYSRQAMGRATALERVPSVVGYSQAGDSSFGWVLGPHAVLDPRGRIDMAQLLKTYDLSVDMSVPGWWPTLGLVVTTAWAPSPALLASDMRKTNNDSLERNGDNQEQHKAGHGQITVPLLRNSVDEFDSFTQVLLGQVPSVKIEDVQGGPINACNKSTLLITGANIWRAKQVFVLGQLLGVDAITITADMKGILLSVPPIIPPRIGELELVLYVITPIGRSNWKDVKYLDGNSGDGCKTEGTQTDGAAKDAVSKSCCYD